MKNVLVIEDQPSSLDFMQLILEQANCRVHRCANGHEALAALWADAFDLIVADINLPDINGIEFLRFAAREHASLPPCIGVSSCDDAGLLSAAHKAGMIKVLKKPVHPIELVDACDALMHRNGPSPPKRDSNLNLAVLEGIRNLLGSEAVSDFADNALADLERSVRRLQRLAARSVHHHRWFYFTDALRGVAVTLGADLLAATAREASRLSLEEIPIAGPRYATTFEKLLDDVENDLKEIPYLTISARERAVIRLAANGLNNAAIAALLDIKCRTVVFHLQKIARKLQTRGRVQTVAQAVKNRVI